MTDKLPGDIWHGWRYMLNKPNSDEIYVAVGVNCNVCLLNTTSEGIQFASIYAFNVVTKTFTQVASGEQNSGKHKLLGVGRLEECSCTVQPLALAKPG